MTHEQRAAWIRRIVVLLLAAGIVVGVWFYPKPKDEAATPEAPPKSVTSPENGLALIHDHRPRHDPGFQIGGRLHGLRDSFRLSFIILFPRSSSGFRLTKCRPLAGPSAAADGDFFRLEPAFQDAGIGG
jgi:hypothetical protein